MLKIWIFFFPPPLLLCFKGFKQQQPQQGHFLTTLLTISPNKATNTTRASEKSCTEPIIYPNNIATNNAPTVLLDSKLLKAAEKKRQRCVVNVHVCDNSPALLAWKCKSRTSFFKASLSLDTFNSSWLICKDSALDQVAEEREQTLESDAFWSLAGRRSFGEASVLASPASLLVLSRTRCEVSKYCSQ